jgi:hypothetical protein
MKITQLLSAFFIIFLGSISVHADLEIKTQFSGDEGYRAGAIDKSKQLENPIFAEPKQSIGGLYYPSSQAPNFGVLRRNPTSSGARVICVEGEGFEYKAGGTWSTRLSYTFEGVAVDSSKNKFPTMLGGVGFTNSKTEISQLIFCGIQKTPKVVDNYQFYVFGKGGGGFFLENVSYNSIGDDTSDSDDLSDKLEIELTLTKSQVEGEFNFVASLTNLNSGKNVATLKGTLTMPQLYKSNLYAYISSGAEREEGNYDLFNAHAFSYEAKK